MLELCLVDSQRSCRDVLLYIYVCQKDSRKNDIWSLAGHYWFSELAFSDMRK